MGRKGNCFSSVKKALSPESKEKKAQKSKEPKKKWFGKEKSAVPDSSPLETVTVSHPLPPPPEEVKLTEVKNEQTKHALSVAVATAAAAEAAVSAAQAAAEVVRLTTVPRFTGKSKEEVAAIRIQTAFRGYLARRALRALRGLVRLRLLVQGPTAKRQTANTLRCMQTLARVQSQIHCRRLRMAEENQTLQRQLLQKRAKELESLRMGEEWDDSLQSKEQIEANMLSKFEAALRRERAMAYSFTHQQTRKKSTRSTNLLFMDPNNPHWGWSWLERWMAARPWETQSTTQKEPNNLSFTNGEITKSFVRHQLNSDKANYPSTPTSKSAFSSGKLKQASPRMSGTGPEDDAKSVFSVLSEMNRRHSIAGSSVRDDESVGSYSAVPSYMGSTESAKAKSRIRNPLAMENGMPENGLVGSAKKRLSFPPSPARLRRHSGPPKVDSVSTMDRNARNGGAGYGRK